MCRGINSADPRLRLARCAMRPSRCTGPRTVDSFGWVVAARGGVARNRMALQEPM